MVGFADVLPCGRRCLWSRRRFLRKMNLLPRPPLLGEVASSEAMMTKRFDLQMPYS
ncbi:hypothetical protein FAEPRAA2165_01344 [Faecalibacterium duncaniae]|uniref:Uncharacterized protein n=1 Tax=Faecalibacterium duncaniae (strain DSM 17677 / JCM 31915 / A2-165) TaxID=411483 RepID=C7H4X4_FAED2|nr:hypothetical protein FAEPRAA2165_01344 [Faecalibacterium duncaniae]